MSEQDHPRDLVVLGAGPGGYVGAVRAAQLGLSVTLVEKDRGLGGTCLHRGCIPTKALLESASILDQARRAATWGIQVEGCSVNWPKVQARKEKVVGRLTRGLDGLMKRHDIQVVQGQGRLAGPGQVVVEGKGEEPRKLAARNVLLATGSVPRALPSIPFDGERILSSDHILKLEQVPSRLVILGAGAVGVEFASIFGRFGCDVTLVELLPRVLPLEDEEISAAMEKDLVRQGITVKTATRAVEARPTGKGVEVDLAGEGDEGSRETVTAEYLLVAVGRAPVSADVGLETVGIETDRAGFVPVDPFCRTSAPGVYAIGDLIPGPMLAHVASAEAMLAADHVAGRSCAPIDYHLVPSCTYSEPEAASVGYTEREARERGHEVKVGHFPMGILGKAMIEDIRSGFVKIVTEERYGEILGVHILGGRATELIAEACVAMRLESTAEELARTIHAHPTLPETIMEAAQAALGASIEG